MNWSEDVCVSPILVSCAPVDVGHGCLAYVTMMSGNSVNAESSSGCPVDVVVYHVEVEVSVLVVMVESVITVVSS